jgi:hypothetical protein
LRHRRDFLPVVPATHQRTAAGAASCSLKTGLSKAWRLRAVLSLRAAGGVARGSGGRWNGAHLRRHHWRMPAVLLITSESAGRGNSYLSSSIEEVAAKSFSD